MIDAEEPCDRLDVGVALTVYDTDAVAVFVHVLVIVLVPEGAPDALAPSVMLLVGVYEACGQKHIGFKP